MNNLVFLMVFLMVFLLLEGKKMGANPNLVGNGIDGEVGNVASVVVGLVKVIALSIWTRGNISNGSVAEDYRGTQASLGSDASVVDPVAGELAVAAANGGGVGGKVDQRADPGSVVNGNGVQNLQKMVHRKLSKGKLRD